MKNWKIVLIVFAGVIMFIVMCVLGIQSAQNKAFNYEEQVNTSMSDIKVQEKRRVDLIYNLVDCVKAYDKHEAELIKSIADGRSNANAETAIIAVAEAYPELKSNENYNQLMTELAVTENLIAEHRSTYNSSIKDYNRYVRQFPTRLWLNILGYESQNYQYLDYEVSADAPQNLFGD